jgi:hypothetical protein
MVLVLALIEGPRVCHVAADIAPDAPRSTGLTLQHDLGEHIE